MKKLMICFAAGLAILVGGCQQTTEKDATTNGFESIDVEADAAQKLVASGEVKVLDVRTQAEWDAGHIADAVHVSIADPEFEAKMAKLDYSKPYVVH